MGWFDVAGAGFQLVSIEKLFLRVSVTTSSQTDTATVPCRPCVLKLLHTKEKQFVSLPSHKSFSIKNLKRLQILKIIKWATFSLSLLLWPNAFIAFRRGQENIWRTFYLGATLELFVTENLKAEYPFILREFTQDSLPYKAVTGFGRKEK